MSCCQKPRTSDFSYFKGPLKTEPVDHLFCHGCGSHLYGDKGKAKFYTKQQWEAWINS